MAHSTEMLRSQLEGLFRDIEDSSNGIAPAPPDRSAAKRLFSGVQHSVRTGGTLSASADSPADAGGRRGAGEQWAAVALRRAWRSLTVPVRAAGPQGQASEVATGLATIVVLLLAGALVGSVIGPHLWAEPPVVVAMALPSPSPGPPSPNPSPPMGPSPSPTSVAPSPTPGLTGTSQPTSTLPPTSAPSPVPSQTPTLPSSSAALVVPLPFPTPGPTVLANALAAISYTLPIPTPVSPVPVALDAVNILVLGSDQRPDWSDWRTDAIHVVSIQPSRAAVSVLSIPRDLFVYIPGFSMSRVNFADFYGEAYGNRGGGPALLRDTLLYNLGIRVDYTVRTDFDGLIGIVDALGGVNIPVHCRLSDYWPYPDENGEYPTLTLEPGVHHMDGETALWYARSRRTTSVFSRERRQQQVLQAIWHKIRDTGVLTQIPALWEQMREMVVTDMDLAAVLNLAQVALSLQDLNIRFYSVGWGMVTPWTTIYGGSVFLPRWEAIEPVVAEAMAPIPQARLARTFTTVEVWNGTSNAGWEHLAADRLMRAGFPAVVGEPDRRDYAQTRLIIYSEHAKGTGVEYLQRMFGIPAGQLTYQPGDSSTPGFRLILGSDYQTCFQ